ncbi:MAG TPA: M14 family metallopeptidase [Candidatus Hydrogenedentes bacterium]|nr:M14 family metallopeptidase [Candidatus Hydrogenedentota bacterium]
MEPKAKAPRDASMKINYSFLSILTGSDLSRRRLPMMVARSINPGPVVWMTACVHGDEVGSIVIIQEIFKRIRKRRLLCGELHAFPLMNPIGFETSSRNITFSKEDLNRSFPGNKNGSLGERIANRIFSTILQTQPALVLDLHNDWMHSIPYAVVDKDPGTSYQEAYEKTREFGKKSGFLVISDVEEVHRALSFNLIKQNVPAVTLELGESYVVNEKNTEYGVKAIWNILTDLGMVEAMEAPFVYPAPEEYRGKVLRYSDKPFSSTSGIIRFLTRAGDVVKKGQPIGRIYNAFGKHQETISALDNGIVLGYSDSSVVFPGTPVMAFALNTEAQKE